MWKERVHIYGTSGVHNNFPKKSGTHMGIYSKTVGYEYVTNMGIWQFWLG